MNQMTFSRKKSNTNDLNQNTKTESPVKNSEIQQRIKRLQMPENEIQLQLKVHQSWKSTLRKTMMTKTQVLVIPKMIQTDYGAYAVNRTITVSWYAVINVKIGSTEPVWI